MIPVQPFSVKLNEEERARLKDMALLLDRTEGKVIRDALDLLNHLIHATDSTVCPKVVEIGRLALSHRDTGLASASLLPKS